MKRILTIILAIMAITACDPADKSDVFNPESLLQTKWEGDLKFYEGGRLKSSSTVTLRFDSMTEGEFFQKRSGSPTKENYEFIYKVSGQTITFDSPVINGSWSVSDYNSVTMKLTLEPSRNGVMILSVK